MKKIKLTFKRVLLGSLSILLLSFLTWMIVLLNPGISYAHQTQFGQVTVYHNTPLQENTGTIIANALEIIKTSKLYSEDVDIQLCLKEDSNYRNLHPAAGGIAYSFLNKSVFHHSDPDFDRNISEYTWDINNNEQRKVNLTWLLAHEFTHNLQYHANGNYVVRSTMGSLNWKLEGHAEYIARKFKGDGLLKAKIANFLLEEKKEFKGLPVFELEDGTYQILSYYKYALAIQYLMEEKRLDFEQICTYETDLDVLFNEMTVWKNTTTD